MGLQIVIDTREKRAWAFPGHVTRVKTLKSGDYSLLGHHNSGVAIERKSFDDLYGSMTAGRIRFYNELRRLGEFGLAALIVEAGEERVLMGSSRTKVNPHRMVSTLYAWCSLFRIQLHFCENRLFAQRKALRLLSGWADSRGINASEG